MSENDYGAPLPQVRNKRFLRINTPKLDQRLRGTLLAHRFRGEWTHWDGRPYLCYRDPACWGCKKRLPNRWNGYSAWWNHGTHKLEILGLSEGAGNLLLPLKIQFGSLRGLTIETWREDPARENSKQLIKLIGTRNEAELPKCPDILDSLNIIWGINEDQGRKRALEMPDGQGDRLQDGHDIPGPKRQPDEPKASGQEWRRIRRVVDAIGDTPEGGW